MSSNRILSRLSRADFALLEPHLEAVDLPVNKSLETRKRRIDQIYFPESGFASVVANGTDKPSIEVGIIGREGLTGLAVVLGNDRASHDTFIQVAGKGQRISAAKLREADGRSPDAASCPAAVRQRLPSADDCHRSGQRPQQNGGASGALAADGDDRLDGDKLPLTHEFLGFMLGTYRPGVTKAVQALEKEGLIAARRGGITILDRKGLEKRSNGTYVPA